eukprot:jgi/Chrzof1/6331/Cz18g04160.t1
MAALQQALGYDSPVLAYCMLHHEKVPALATQKTLRQTQDKGSKTIMLLLQLSSSEAADHHHALVATVKLVAADHHHAPAHPAQAPVCMNRHKDWLTGIATRHTHVAHRQLISPPPPP